MAPKIKLIEIQGIGDKTVKKLVEGGIGNVDAFLEATKTKKSRAELAAKLKVEEANLLKWANFADLCRIKGISTHYSQLLEAAGIDTVAELAKRVPANLLKKLVETNAARPLVKRLPTEKEVEAWVAQAKELPKLIKH